jgi:hypothetical protein
MVKNFGNPSTNSTPGCLNSTITHFGCLFLGDDARFGQKGSGYGNEIRYPMTSNNTGFVTVYPLTND